MARHLPNEPEFGVIHTQTDIIRALNYYGTRATDDDIRNWAECWCAAHKIDGSLRHRTVGELKTYACFWRMLERGLIMEDGEIERISKAFQNLVAKDAPKVVIDKPKVVRKVERTGSEVLSNLDAYLDDVTTGKITSSRAPSLATTAKDVAELRDACERGVARLIEEKEFYDRAVWKSLKNAYNGILDSLEGFEAKLKTERARVTKKRVKAPGVVAKDVKFLKEFQGFRGATPEKLVGAKKAYVFDTEARKLKVFIATGDGFTFTGTTLKNFDAEKSKGKTVRKPETLMATPMNLSSLNKFFGDIKAVEGAVNGRFNENTIILSFT